MAGERMRVVLCATHLLDDREANLCVRRQRLGQVLHHALKPCGALERRLAGILIPASSSSSALSSVGASVWWQEQCVLFLSVA
jgi:hypothetical protein